MMAALQLAIQDNGGQPPLRFDLKQDFSSSHPVGYPLDT